MLYLLDSNVLIALATPDHTTHNRAMLWFQPGKDFATCPITQGFLIRFYIQMRCEPPTRRQSQAIAEYPKFPSILSFQIKKTSRTPSMYPFGLPPLRSPATYFY